MQGRKIIEWKLFCTVSIDALATSNHPIRRIAKVLDLRFLYDETQSFYSEEGRPSVDPIVLFKLYLIAYFFGIPSERRLMKKVQVNLGYRWYLGYDLEEEIPVYCRMRIHKSQSRSARYNGLVSSASVLVM